MLVFARTRDLFDARFVFDKHRGIDRHEKTTQDRSSVDGMGGDRLW